MHTRIRTQVNLKFKPIKSFCFPNVEYCFNDRKYNETVFLLSHLKCGSFHNQEKNMYKQLSDGVRGFVIDVDPNDCCKKLCRLNSENVICNKLNYLKNFLELNSEAIITIIFRNKTVPPSYILKNIHKIGLSKYVYNTSMHSNWITLNKMISLNQRLVLFFENSFEEENSDQWYLAWNKIAATFDNFPTSKDLLKDTGKIHRGKIGDQKLILLNHYSTNNIESTYSKKDAIENNSASNLYSHVKKIEKNNGQHINFINLDYYNLPNTQSLIKTIKRLNFEF